MEFSSPDIRFWALLPLVIVAVGGMVVLLRGVFAPDRTAPLRESLLVCAAAAVATIFVGFMGPSDSFAGMLRMDPATVLFWLNFELATALVLIAADERLGLEGARKAEALALILFCSLGMMVMAGSAHLVMLFLGLETMSMALYILAGLAGAHDPKSNEAALKYLLLGAFATGFLLYGMAFLYGACGTLQLRDVSDTVRIGRADPAFLGVGLSLLTVGLGFKVALVPFHMWAPDVYEGAPTPVTALMAVGPKVAGFAAMVRLLVEAGEPVQRAWAPLLATLAVLTMLVGNVLALAQTNIKRLLAFSSVAHAGYLAVGIVAGAGLGVQAVLFYGLSYTFMTLGAFVVVMLVEAQGGGLDVAGYAGLARRSPLAAGFMAFFLVALAAIPPTAGFIGKWLLFVAAVHAGYTPVAVLGVLCALIGVYYYLRIVVRMYFEDPRETTPIELTAPARLVLWSAAGATLVLGFPFCFPFLALAGWGAG